MPTETKIKEYDITISCSKLGGLQPRKMIIESIKNDDEGWYSVASYLVLENGSKHVIGISKISDFDNAGDAKIFIGSAISEHIDIDSETTNCDDVYFRSNSSVGGKIELIITFRDADRNRNNLTINVADVKDLTKWYLESIDMVEKPYVSPFSNIPSPEHDEAMWIISDISNSINNIGNDLQANTEEIAETLAELDALLKELEEE